MIRKKYLCRTVLMTLLGWGALGWAGLVSAIEFNDGYVRALIPGQRNTVAFFKVSNPANQAWRIVSVSSGVAGKVEIHEHVHDDGTMRMRAVPCLELAAGESVNFKPGGLHLMLFDVNEALEEGQMVEILFSNAEGDTVSQIFPVVSVLNEHAHHGR